MGLGESWDYCPVEERRCQVGSGSGRCCCLRAEHQPELLELERFGAEKAEVSRAALLGACLFWGAWAGPQQSTTGSNGEHNCTRHSGWRVHWDILSACCWKEIIHPCQLGALRSPSLLALNLVGHRATASV